MRKAEINSRWAGSTKNPTCYLKGLNHLDSFSDENTTCDT